jgi:sporulation protein YlmC with PRC-barrel domain
MFYDYRDDRRRDRDYDDRDRGRDVLRPDREPHDLRDRYDDRDRRRFEEERRFGFGDGQRREDRFDPRYDEGPDQGGGAGVRGPAYDFGRTDRRYSIEDTRRALPMEETDRLISSEKVEGTAVYDMTGRRIGEVRSFMVEKRSGRVAYAIVRVRGGFVSGETYRPVDWNDLHYHERLDGYQIDVERRELRRDRSFEEGR